MGILLTIVFGALIGYLASLVTHRDAEQGWLGNVVVGIAGAFIGSYIGSFFGSYSLLRFDFVGLFWAFVGAVVLCLALNYFQGYSRGRNTLR